LDWFFEHEEAGIILEDDCLPHPDFWRFCSELLDKYADDDRVFMISGDNFQEGKRVSDDSYYVSALTHIWGWAAWRRSWQKVDLDLSGYDESSPRQVSNQAIENERSPNVGRIGWNARHNRLVSWYQKFGKRSDSNKRTAPSRRFGHQNG
jgi:hypothetical protein